jgi:hypothetical protein
MSLHSRVAKLEQRKGRNRLERLSDAELNAVIISQCGYLPTWVEIPTLIAQVKAELAPLSSGKRTNGHQLSTLYK